MPSLYQVLLAQYPQRLKPVRCTQQTVAQLHSYFESTVLENNLYGLLIENFPLARQRSLREVMRLRELSHEIQHGFLLVAEGDELGQQFPSHSEWNGHELRVLKDSRPDRIDERFLVIADERFAALMATAPRQEDRHNDEEDTSTELIWTFEPEIICAALEFLVKTVVARQLPQAASFAKVVQERYPQIETLPLTVTVASRLAQLLQEQAGREIAVNRIATTIRKSLEIESILQTTVEEVGQALKAEACALRVAGEGDQPAFINYAFREGTPESEATLAELLADLDAYDVRLSKQRKSYVRDGQEGPHQNDEILAPLAAVALRYQERSMGVLLVRLGEKTRVWQESELLLLHTVADQVAVAVNHARLFAQVQQQALTDVLTDCHNRRAFEGQLERDLHMATRLGQPLSLLLLDIDKFKAVNDTYGHDAGDAVLRLLAQTLREELRRVDTAARIGGEEFAVILPQSDMFGALAVAERLRLRIEKLDVPRVGHITASFGVSVFPFHGSQRNQLFSLADRALYLAKQTGRNRICLPPDEEIVIEADETMFASDELLAGVA
jgi:diguanylate cyclase (GGDEF)-like protein